MALIFLLPLLFLCCYLIYLRYTKRPLRFPPGPVNFPLIGCFPQLLAELDSTGLSPILSKWSKIYGPIFSMNFCTYPIVAISDAKLIRAAFSMSQFSGRPSFPATNLRMGDDGKARGLAFNVGTSWVEQRRFSIRHLKDFGVGKNTMENIILNEAEELIATFKRENERPVSTDAKFNIAIINSLWAIVAGHRFKYDDPILRKLVACITESASKFSPGVIFLPTLSQMFPRLSGWKAYAESFQTTQAFINVYCETRLQAHVKGYLNDFTDAYIENMRNTTDETSSFYKEEGVKNMTVVLNDLFSAGGETTSTALTWVLMCLAINPKVQRKLHEEIDRVVGPEKFPGLGDRSRMPYAEAIITEVLRISSVFPVGISHLCVEDVEFNGFLIPKDTLIMPNVQGVHMDPLIWGDPESFRPERFLTPDGKSTLSHPAFLPFSTGRRACLGETLARDELFLISTSILQAFEIIPDPNAAVPTLKPVVDGAIARTQSHKLSFIARH